MRKCHPHILKCPCGISFPMFYESFASFFILFVSVWVPHAYHGDSIVSCVRSSLPGAMGSREVLMQHVPVMCALKKVPIAWDTRGRCRKCNRSWHQNKFRFRIYIFIKFCTFGPFSINLYIHLTQFSPILITSPMSGAEAVLAAAPESLGNAAAPFRWPFEKNVM